MAKKLLMTSIHQHNKGSKLMHDGGMQHSADPVGQERHPFFDY